MLLHIFPSRCKWNFLPFARYIHLQAALLTFASRKQLLRVVCLQWAWEENSSLPLSQQKQARNFFLASLNSQISDSRLCSCWRIVCHHQGTVIVQPSHEGLRITFSLMYNFIFKGNKSQNWESKHQGYILAVCLWATYQTFLSHNFSICVMEAVTVACWTTGQIDNKMK